MTKPFTRIIYAVSLGLLFSCNETPERTNNAIKKSFSPQFKRPVIMQNSGHLKSGEKVEITIQTESFTDTSSSRVQVDGVDIPSEIGKQVNTAIYYEEAMGDPGPHMIFVTVIHLVRGKEVKTDKDTVFYTIEK